MNNEKLKKTLLHYINLEYYANELDEEFQTLLSELQQRCNKAICSQPSINTKSEYGVIYKIIKEEVDKFQKELEERLEEEAERIMNLEKDFLDNIYNKAPRKSEDNSGIKKNLLVLSGISLAKLLFSPIDGKDTAKQFAERTGKNILRSYDTSLRAGYLFGQKSEDVNTQITNKMKQVARGMQSGIRTAIPSFAKTTDRIVFLNNNVEVVWVATLDGRTCITCASLSGVHFKSISEAPSVPLHCMCRCILYPVKDLIEPVPDFSEFIESLDEDDQKSVLGANRYEMWKKYDISLDKFLNNGTVISVDDLKNSPIITNAETAKLVKKNYPNDTFIRRKLSDNASLYISKERIRAGIKDPLVYKSDKMMATTLARMTGRDFYMLSENKVGVANPDGFFIDNTIEMKHVRAGIEKLGKNAIHALKQSENVFLYCDRSFSKKDCIDKIRGSLYAKKGTANKNGLDFTEPNKNSLLYIYTDGKLYKLHWGDTL